VHDIDYSVLTRDQVVDMQAADIAKVSEVLGTAPAFTRVLLMHFRWDTERLLMMSFERGREEVFKARRRC
jgi:hypothetical protein